MSHTDQHRFAMQVAQLSRAWRAELEQAQRSLPEEA